MFHYFILIIKQIGRDKNKIIFNLIYSLGEQEKNFDRFHANVNVKCPKIFILIIGHLSIFGLYCSNFYIDNKKHWSIDSNAFLFSINLYKKYPAKKAIENFGNANFILKI